MRAHLLAMLPLLTAGLTACGEEDPGEVLDQTDPAPNVQQVDEPKKDPPVQEPDPATLDASYMLDRWILVNQPDDLPAEERRACPELAELLQRDPNLPALPKPELSQWRVQPLFGVDRDDRIGAPPTLEGAPKKGLPAAPPPELTGYCLYQRATPATAEDKSLTLEHVRRERGFVFTPDSKIIHGSASWNDVLNDAIVDRFQRRTYTLQGQLPSGVPATSLVLLDTAPTSGPGSSGPAATNTSPHGWAMARLARALSCVAGGGDCAAELSTRLTMPLVRGASDDDVVWNLKDGGYFGSTGWLAQAIRREVMDRDPRERVVLAMPLGWLQVFERGDAGSAAVREALIDARCRGALIVAAAGNHTGMPPFHTGPTLPAAWTDLLYATDWKCPASAQVRIEADEPLLFAAGGLDAEGQLSALSRPESTPHLLAYAEHATTQLGTDHPPAMSGTSVSTVVLASAAATLWTNNPDATATELMEALYAKGQELPWEADVDIGPAGLGDKAHAIAPCDAFAGGAFTCGPQRPEPADLASTVPTALKITRADLDLFRLPATVLAGPFDFPAAGTATAVGSCGALCPSSGCGDSDANFVACPREEVCSASCAPWTHPQPAGDWCPTCPFKTSNGTLGLWWNDPGPSYNVILEVYDRGDLVDVYHLGMVPQPGIVQVSPTPPDQFTKIDQALLLRTEMVNGDPVLQISPAILVP